jgi:hypothetical protein
MTNMPPEDSFLPYALTTVGITLPTYLLIIIVNNPDAVRLALANLGLFLTNLASCAAPQKAGKMKEKLQHQKSMHDDLKNPPVRRAATHASLEARLSTDLSLEPILGIHMAQGLKRMSQSISHHLPGSGRKGASQAAPIVHPFPAKLPIYSEQEEQDQFVPGRCERSSTIKFEEPLYSPTRWKVNEVDVINLRAMERTESIPSNMMPLSPGTTLVSEPTSSIRRANTVDMMVLRDDGDDDGGGGSINRSLLRRFSDRFSSPVHTSTTTSEPDGQLPKEEV